MAVRPPDWQPDPRPTIFGEDERKNLAGPRSEVSTDADARRPGSDAL